MPCSVLNTRVDRLIQFVYDNGIIDLERNHIPKKMGAFCIKISSRYVVAKGTCEQASVDARSRMSNKQLRKILKKIKRRKRKSPSALYRVREPKNSSRFVIRRGSLHDNGIIPGFIPGN